MKGPSGLSFICLLLSTATNLCAWHTVGSDVHEYNVYDSLRTIDSSIYPDLHKYIILIEAGSDTEVHNTAWDKTDNANALNGGYPKAWWDDGKDKDGNPKNALYYYKTFNISQAYNYIGRMTHLIQDQAVPAHGANIAHAWWKGGDKLESDANSHYVYPGVASQKISDLAPHRYYNTLQNFTFVKVAQSDAVSTSSWRRSSENAYWLTDDYDDDGPDGWGMYGGGTPGNRQGIISAPGFLLNK